MPAASTNSQCVVLAAADAVHRKVLREALAHRGWDGAEFEDPYQAFAHLCLFDSGQRLRMAWGLPGKERSLLIVVEPKAHPEFDSMLAAVERYLPQAEVLEHRTEGLLHMKRAAPSSTPPRTAEPVSQAPRIFECTAVTAPWSDEVVGEPERPEHADSISRQEIEMLLALESRD